MISSRELAEATGATYRQIDYWTTSGVIEPVGKARPGSGSFRSFDEEWIPIVKLFVKIAKQFRYNHHDLLRKVVLHYDLGFVVLEDGLRLVWRVESEAASSSVPDGSVDEVG